jgi:hypothetical protein
MYALRGIAYAHEGKAGITVPANASSSFSRRGDEESFETSTRVREGEFLESIKKACRLSPTRFMVIAHQQNLVPGLVSRK